MSDRDVDAWSFAAIDAGLDGLLKVVDEVPLSVQARGSATGARMLGTLPVRRVESAG
jgi:hypothetical protein